MTSSVLIPIPIPTSDAPGAIANALARPGIAWLQDQPFPLPAEADLQFFRDELPKRLDRKNVSLYPNGSLKGAGADAAVIERVRRVLSARMQSVTAFLERCAPTVAKGMRLGTTSFRPIEEQGRHLSAHASNELIHLDAGAYGATHGDRILRVFTNVNPSMPRVWTTKGDIHAVLQRYADRVGLSSPVELAQGPFGKLYSALCRGLGSLTGLATTAIDTSPYDRAMRRLHNFMKDTPVFQADPVGHEELSFPPFSSWLVFTDAVSHACIRGQFAFVDTFIVPRENVAAVSAPWSLLERGVALRAALPPS